MPQTPCLRGSCVTDLRQSAGGGTKRHGSVTVARFFRRRVFHPGCFIFDVSSGQPSHAIFRNLRQRKAYETVALKDIMGMPGIARRYWRWQRSRNATTGQNGWGNAFDARRFHALRTHRSMHRAAHCTARRPRNIQEPKKKRPPCSSQDGRPLFARRYQAGTPDSSPRNPYRHMRRYSVMREIPNSAATSVRR